MEMTVSKYAVVCEWNKHMDRHERPYKCHEAGSGPNPGFTYSGGPLMHQGEVHKMHLVSDFCPFPNCNVEILACISMHDHSQDDS